MNSPTQPKGARKAGTRNLGPLFLTIPVLNFESVAMKHERTCRIPFERTSSPAHTGYSLTVKLIVRKTAFAPTVSSMPNANFLKAGKVPLFALSPDIATVAKSIGWPCLEKCPITTYQWGMTA